MLATRLVSVARLARRAFSAAVQCGLLIGLSAAALNAAALSLTGVQSRKLHGAVAHDLPIDATKSIAGAVTFESRAIGAGHRIVFQFDAAITSAGTLAVVDELSVPVATPAPTISGATSQDIIVDIPALADDKRVAISLTNINGIGLNVSAALGFRVGDTNHSGTLTAGDVSRVKARAAQPASNANFQFDVNTSALVTAADIAAVKTRSGLFVIIASTLNAAGLASPRTAGVAGTLTVTARDAIGNTATNYTGTVHFTSSDALAVLPANYTFTSGDNGVHTFPVTLNTPGTQSVTVTDTANASIAGSQSGIVVNAPALPGLFEKLHGWNKDVSAFPPSPRSAAIIAALQSLGGWGGTPSRLQTDFSIAVLEANSATPRRTVNAAPGYYSPDGETLPMQMPIPVNGNTEGSANYACNTAAEDCHVLVIERTEKKLYELYNATSSGGDFTALGAFVWDLTKQYGEVLRGDQCTSADAAGLPMAALIPTADEVAAGVVPHALRFILPNSRMKKGAAAHGYFVRPATHAGAPGSTNADAPPYGVRFRLKASFDETPYSTGARVILRAMKKYGMILSDGGNIALTFADDRLSTAKWAALGITSQTFNSIPVDQFDVVDLGAEIESTFDCVRAP